MTADAILNKILRDNGAHFADWEKEMVVIAMEEYASIKAHEAADKDLMPFLKMEFMKSFKKNGELY